MSLTNEQQQRCVERFFTNPEIDAFDQFDWELRDARIQNYLDGTIAFEQNDVEVPTSWSVMATNIVSQKYFREIPGQGRERSLKQLVDRVANTIARWGEQDGYFASQADAETFCQELRFILTSQRAAFNSPVWFNIGVPGARQQASACFILSVDDSIDSILNWYREEGTIFKGGSGSGVNLSAIRGSHEPLSGGGIASGPVSFMRGADSSAGAIKSGGTTRRAAKMVILDVDHPDIESFVWCKAKEERKARVLGAAGFDVGLDGEDSVSIQYQNANNSVRVSDEFMEAVLADEPWSLTERSTGRVCKTLRARDLMMQIAQAAWECADPGVQYDTTINRWHTAPTHGRITASNPCSEYLHVDNSACNLASINLLPFLSDTGVFDIEAFQHVVSVMFVAQDILVSHADYPTEQIRANTMKFRQLGLGYANLGAMLMSLGLPYDSKQARFWAGAVTSLMTATAYAVSAELAGQLGEFPGFDQNREAMLRVLEMHREASERLGTEPITDAQACSVLAASQQTWRAGIAQARVQGVRNAQATVLAPTGTISFMLDCDTTGIEPDLALVKSKNLVGGGSLRIVNQSVPRALTKLGYDEATIGRITTWIDEHQSVVGSPDLAPEHVAVFACSMGDNPIHYSGHLHMMASVQPFISGAISKTINTPSDATVEDIYQIYVDGWHLGLKAVAVYRDNCKVDQPLSTSSSTNDRTEVSSVAAVAPVEEHHLLTSRQRLPRTRRSHTFEFRVADCKGFATVGEYDDGRPGELFVRVSKQGSTLAGIMDAFAIAVSHGLQYGVPFKAYVEAFVGMRFEPAGMTDDPEVRIANSLMDYLFRRLALEYLSVEERSDLAIFAVSERSQQTLPGVEESTAPVHTSIDLTGPTAQTTPPSASEQADQRRSDVNAPLCMTCGVVMQRAGSCFACTSCGSTSGCS